MLSTQQGQESVPGHVDDERGERMRRCASSGYSVLCVLPRAHKCPFSPACPEWAIRPHATLTFALFKTLFASPSSVETRSFSDYQFMESEARR